MRCQLGLHYNPSTDQCDWPHLAGCKGNNSPDKTTRPTSERPSSTGSPFPLPNPEICKGPGLFPDPGDCAAFYNCDEQLVAHHMRCAPGTLFNPTPKCNQSIPNNPACEPTCDWPRNVDCGNRPLPGTPTTQAPEQPTAPQKGM